MAANDSRIVLYDYYGISGIAEVPGSRFEAFPGASGGAESVADEARAADTAMARACAARDRPRLPRSWTGARSS